MEAPGTDEQLLDQIADVCRWYAGRPPTSQRQATALAELACLADMSLIDRWSREALLTARLVQASAPSDDLSQQSAFRPGINS